MSKTIEARMAAMDANLSGRSFEDLAGIRSKVQGKIKGRIDQGLGSSCTTEFMREVGKAVDRHFFWKRTLKIMSASIEMGRLGFIARL